MFKLIFIIASAFAQDDIYFYLNRFEQASRRYNEIVDINKNTNFVAANIKVELQDNQLLNHERAFAYCRYGDDKLIVINRIEWKKASDETRESVLFHELGHCILNREHSEVRIGNRPASLMYPIELPDTIYNQFRDEYIKELFLNKK